MRSPRFEILVVIGLLIASAVAFGQVTSNQFIVLDDPVYLTENPQVQQGFSLESLVWALRTTHGVNWMPLTWLSHMLDFTLYGPDAGGHHLTSLLLHTANAILLFFVLRTTTGRAGPGAVVALLFLIHPLQVEPVAWASQRKTLLNGFFWFLTLAAYLRYARKPAVGTYLPVLLAYALSLLAKPATVTIPFLLLLLDFWPLKRISFDAGEKESSHWPRKLGILVAEKLPLFAIAAAASMVTYLAQDKALYPWADLPLGARLANTAVAYATYLRKFVWPGDLAVFYPHPGGDIDAGSLVISLLVLAAISALALARAGRKPVLIVGWLWFLGTLVPMVGIVQVGLQAMADRYMYGSMVGLALMVAYGGHEIVQRRRLPNSAVLISVSLALVVLIGITRVQVRAWENSVSLFEQDLRVVGENDFAHMNLGFALRLEGKPEESALHYRKALALNPKDQQTHHGLAVALSQLGRYDEALHELQEALALGIPTAALHMDTGSMLMGQGRLEEAVVEFRRALEIEPKNATAYYNLGRVYANLGNLDSAIASLQKVLQLAPDSSPAHFGLGVAFAQAGRLEEAAFHYGEALRLRPDFEEARLNLEIVQQRSRAGGGG